MLIKEPIKTVYEVEIYEDKDGNSDLKDWLRDLKCRKENGNKDCETYFEDIWELRPDRHRVMFFQVRDGRIILLNYFRKETQKTPSKDNRNRNDSATSTHGI